jgi:hypothetical protein
MILDNGSKVPVTEIPNNTPSIDLTQTAYTPVKVALSLVNIDTNKATINAKLTKIKNGKEATLNTSAVKAYDWSYTLEDLATAKTVTENIKVNSASYNFTLKGLAAESFYRIRITALEDDSDASFNSPSLIFRTNAKSTIDDTKIEFNDVAASIKECKIFIKVKDVFSRAVLYIKEV